MFHFASTRMPAPHSDNDDDGEDDDEHDRRSHDRD